MDINTISKLAEIVSRSAFLAGAALIFVGVIMTASATLLKKRGK